MAGPTLNERAEEFAQELTDTFAGVFGGGCMPKFVAEASPKSEARTTRVLVHTEDSQEICLTITGEHALTLVCEFQCVWDHQGRYLKVRRASIHVSSVTETTPLFRYEFEDEMQQARLPCAHLHVHAHRDEFLFTMLRSQRGKPSSRTKAATGVFKSSPPRLSNVHFPLGGPRMRPCVEDVLQMLVAEFEVDTVDGASEALRDGRARWRRRQIGTAVRDAPGEAVRVLREMGYQVTDPADGPAIERLDKLTRF